MRHITIGILAHVDAGKTTLSECMLYLSGQIRKLGRVDHKDAFLDTYELERERGITIFSKQAELKWAIWDERFWIHRGMWISPQKWSVPCRYWIMRSW
mgnify:CR=1 FL=1